MGTEFQINPTEDDLVVCECGSSYFQNVESFYKVGSPLIGQPPIMVSIKSAIKCLKCGNIIPTELAQTVKDCKKL